MATHKLRVVLETEEQGVVNVALDRTWRFASASGAGILLPKREQVSLTGSTFVALSPPTSAKAMILLPETGISLTLKGITGDGGTTIAPASAPLGLPIMLQLGVTPSVGVANGDSAAVIVTVWWL